MMNAPNEIKNYKVIEPAKEIRVILLDYERGLDIVAQLSNKSKNTLLGGMSDRDIITLVIDQLYLFLITIININ